ncbi:hypothetical protein IAE22_35265, partial [Bacillus sp. S34]|nr:hypothetical protein [Bacillus sp. S34]
MSTAVGTLSTFTCEAIVTGTTGPVGAAIGAEPCNVGGGLIGDAVVGQRRLQGEQAG